MVLLSSQTPLPLLEKVSVHLNILPVLQKLNQLILEEHSRRETWVDSLHTITKASTLLYFVIYYVASYLNRKYGHVTPLLKNLLFQRTLSYRVNSNPFAWHRRHSQTGVVWKGRRLEDSPQLVPTYLSFLLASLSYGLPEDTLIIPFHSLHTPAKTLFFCLECTPTPLLEHSSI